MKVHHASQITLDASIIAIGAFDGVHKGHQKVIEQMVREGESIDVPSVIYTFDIPPRAYFQGVQILSSKEEKMEKLRRLGVEYTIIATFDAAYLNRSANSFIDELKKMNPLQIIVGDDFRFGYKRKGDIHLLKEHFNVTTVSPVCCENGKRISSTRIRELIHEGKIEQTIPFLA